MIEWSFRDLIRLSHFHHAVVKKKSVTYQMQRNLRKNRISVKAWSIEQLLYILFLETPTELLITLKYGLNYVIVSKSALVVGNAHTKLINVFRMSTFNFWSIDFSLAKSQPIVQEAHS